MEGCYEFEEVWRERCTRLGFWDRVRILLGFPLRTRVIARTIKGSDEVTIEMCCTDVQRQ